MYLGNRVHVCFSVMLASLSLDELCVLLDHHEKTTSIIIEAYRKKLLTEARTDEKQRTDQPEIPHTETINESDM